MAEASNKGALRSKEFDDVYFSAQDGLAETQHVFLDGNGLPGAWQDRKEFVICETGFGTGLNFLAAWKLFEETAGPGQNLHFISIEKYPLRIAEIEHALSPWLAEDHPTSLSHKFHIMQNKGVEGPLKKVQMEERVFLTLLIGDVNDVMPDMNEQVDCWFLDGFRPATNPEMWTQTVFENMARLSKPGASFATFTAAGFVRRGLEEAGFEVRKVKGFGTKREMLAGHKR